MAASLVEAYNRLDSRVLLKKYYTNTIGPKAETLMKFTDFLQKRNKRGNKFLDFGTGPSIHTLITPAKFYDEITVTYYTQGDGDLALKWVNGDNDIFDWSEWVEMVMKKENPSQYPISENSIKERTELVRSKIKHVVRCDIGKDRIVSDTETDVLYDAICSSGCLESACLTYEQYCRAAQKFSDLLNVEGVLLLIGNIQCSFYKIDNQKFPVLKLSKEQIENAFKKAGFSNFTWYVTDKHFYDPSDIDLEGYFFMSAVKK